MEKNSDNELAAVLAHEVKNPVAIIKANIDCIKDVLPQEAIKNIEVIDNAIARIDKIIESYRLINIKTGNDELIYIEDMLMDIIEDYGISRPDIEFSYKSERDLSLYGNYNKLSILFYNLYKNAVEAISGKGNILTEVFSDGKYIVVKINDSGRGIEDIDSVGLPYYTTKEGGTGLGVLICKNIVSEHKGKLYFQNNYIGSSAVVKLPVVKI